MGSALRAAGDDRKREIFVVVVVAVPRLPPFSWAGGIYLRYLEEGSWGGKSDGLSSAVSLQRQRGLVQSWAIG